MTGLRARWAVLVGRVHRAHREAEQAQDRLDRARAEVVAPLNRARDHNQFAQMIRDSLQPGKGN